MRWAETHFTRRIVDRLLKLERVSQGTEIAVKLEYSSDVKIDQTKW